jgi:hypothetical protein
MLFLYGRVLVDVTLCCWVWFKGKLFSRLVVGRFYLDVGRKLLGMVEAVASCIIV